MMKASALMLVLRPSLEAHAVLRLRSLLDVKDVKFTDVSYACPALRHFFPNLTINRSYSDQKSSTIGLTKWKAYVTSSEHYRQLRRKIVNAADLMHNDQPRCGGVFHPAHMETAVNAAFLRENYLPTTPIILQG